MSWCCLPRRDYYYYNYRADADADADADASSLTSSRWQARVSLSFILKTNFEFSPMDTKGKNMRENYILLNECLLIVYGVL